MAILAPQLLYKKLGGNIKPRGRLPAFRLKLVEKGRFFHQQELSPAQCQQIVAFSPLSFYLKTSKRSFSWCNEQSCETLLIIAV